MKAQVIPFGDFKGMSVKEAYMSDDQKLFKLLRWLEKKYEPTGKYAAQNKALIDEIKSMFGPRDYTASNEPIPDAPPLGTNVDQSAILRQINVNLQVLIGFLADTNKKLGVKQDTGDMEIPF